MQVSQDGSGSYSADRIRTESESTRPRKTSSRKKAETSSEISTRDEVELSGDKAAVKSPKAKKSAATKKAGTRKTATKKTATKETPTKETQEKAEYKQLTIDDLLKAADKPPIESGSIKPLFSNYVVDKSKGTIADLGDADQDDNLLQKAAEDVAPKRQKLTESGTDSPKPAPVEDPKIKATPSDARTAKANPVEALAPIVRWIADPDRREFCMKALGACQQEFYTAPASFSGKFHPKENLGDGGLIRHIRKCAFYARKLAGMENLSPDERDDLISATVLHDICKGGIPWKGYAPDHGPIAEKWLENFDTEGKFKDIRHLVGMHMGEFNRPLPTPPKTHMEELICQVDMLGSSKALAIDNLEWNKDAEIPLAGAGGQGGGVDVPIISNLRDCLDQISNPDIKDFAKVYLGSNKVQELSPEKRDQYIYGMDLCRIDKVEGDLKDQILASILLQNLRVPPPATSEDPQITKLKTLLQRPAHFYPEQGRKILGKALSFGCDSPKLLGEFVNLSNEMLKADKPDKGEPPPMDPRTGNFDIGKVQESLDRIASVAQEIRENPEILKKSDKEISAELKNLKEMHKLIHSAAGVMGYTQAISGNLEKAHLLLADVDDARQRLSDMDRTMKWEEVTATFGKDLNPVEKEYFFQNDDIKPDEMSDIINLLMELRDPKSDVNIKGNAILPLHRAEIWQQKMKMIDGAIENPTQNGKPVEIDVEYYELSNVEMLTKLNRAAEKGCKVRVMIDPGHAPNLGKARFNISDIVGRAKTVQTLLLGSEDKDIAVGMFPAKDMLGSKDALMHRKLFRVGDEVILGGMNANIGSGENIDAAQLVKGPAAKRLGEIYAEDLATCKDMTGETLWGEQVMEIIGKGKYINRSKEEVIAERIISPGAFRDLVSVAAGVVPLSAETTPEEVNMLNQKLKERGYDIAELAQFYDLDGDSLVTEKDIAMFLTKDMVSELVLSDKGGQLMHEMVDETLALCNSKRNLGKLTDVNPPSDEVRGDDSLAIGNVPVERQAIVLHAIESAERYIYIPTFVMTEGIARALAAKKQQMAAQGKDIDIRVIIDSGIYSYGSTPNERGFFALEEAGIPVRWSLLSCTNMEHSRKIHAKEIMTDKMILTGSTNMSAKGLRTNWELSGASYFDEGSQKDVQEREAARDDFMRTWNDESIEISTKWLVDESLKKVTTKDIEIRKKEARRTLLLKFLREIDNYQKQVGSLFEEMEREPEVHQEMKALMEEGFSQGYALLTAAKKKYPGYILKKKLEEVPARANLEQIRTNPNAR